MSATVIARRHGAMAGRTLYAVLVALLGGSLFAAALEVPPAAQIGGCEADPVARTSSGAFANLRVSCEDVVDLLAEARVITERQWRHEYSHVAFGDRTGRLTLRNGTVLRWLVRPGGLAFLEWPDGQRTYLVRCCGGRPREAAPGPPQP
jgi:hypothetical protein